jgi:stage II sporulation protein B
VNKTRLTYRIDPNEQGKIDQSNQPNQSQNQYLPNVIPLNKEEFRIIELSHAKQSNDDSVNHQQAERTAYSAWRDPQMMNPLSNDYALWETPMESEVERVERAIHSGDQRPRYPSHEWPELVYAAHQRSANPPWGKLTFSMAGAALIGIVLGFFVLHLFSNDPKQSGLDGTRAMLEAIANEGVTGASTVAGLDPSKIDQSAITPVGANNIQTTAGSLSQSKFASAGTLLEASARTFTVIQGGSYLSKQIADARVADLRKKGYAAVVEPGDQYRVYIGMAQNRDKATTLSKQLQQKLDLYVKSYTIPAVRSVKWNGSADSLKAYLAQTDKLLGMMSDLSLQHLADSKMKPIDEKSLQSLKTAYEAWSIVATSVADGIPNEAKMSLQKVNTSMQTAKKSLDEYNRSPSTATLWNVQSDLMQSLISGNDLLSMISI